MFATSVSFSLYLSSSLSHISVQDSQWRVCTYERSASGIPPRTHVATIHTGYEKRGVGGLKLEWRVGERGGGECRNAAHNFYERHAHGLLGEHNSYVHMNRESVFAKPVVRTAQGCRCFASDYSTVRTTNTRTFTSEHSSSVHSFAKDARCICTWTRVKYIVVEERWLGICGGRGEGAGSVPKDFQLVKYSANAYYPC